MEFLTLCFCLVIVTTQAQLQGLVPAVTNSLPFFSSPLAQQLLQGLQSFSSHHSQGYGSESQYQDLNSPSQQNYGGQPVFNGPPQQNFAGSQQRLNGPSERPGFGGQNGGLQQQTNFGQGSGRPVQQAGLNGPPPQPFGGQQQRLGLGHNHQQQSYSNHPQQQQTVQQNLYQQSGFGGVQQFPSYTVPVQGYSYSYDQNNQGSLQNNYQHFGSDEDHNNYGDQHVEYQQYNNFYQFENSFEQEDPNDHEVYEQQEEVSVDYQ